MTLETIQCEIEEPAENFRRRREEEREMEDYWGDG